MQFEELERYMVRRYEDEVLAYQPREASQASERRGASVAAGGGFWQRAGQWLRRLARPAEAETEQRHIRPAR